MAKALLELLLWFDFLFYSEQVSLVINLDTV